MIRDPFYNDIVARLNDSVNPYVFEHCVSDLLREELPTLVPIPGGDDAGMDGAVADGSGPPFPLVCTTSERVLENLRRSLKSYVRNGGPQRKVIVATTRDLGARRIRNLHNAAGELGFTIIQVYQQQAIANRLYRSPRWCRELLGLTGDPPPLSVLPRSSRPVIDQSVVGRDGDLSWLQDTSGDLLLAGQPGSGKTFLLATFAKMGRGLFAVTENIGELAGGIRAQQPEAVIVDDAHLNPRLVQELRRLREEIGGAFRIVATCWPGEKDDVAQALGVVGSCSRELGLLTRDEIVDVVKGTGIGGPNALIHELVNQAGGKPGLAVTLCQLCLKGEIEEIVTGDALYRDVRITFGKLAGREATAILAGFAVGGKSGLELRSVAGFLGHTTAHVRDVVTRLATGGVVSEVGRRTLSVRPAALRHALVRDVFFNGATSLRVNDLVARAPDLSEVARTLIGARARGGLVPDSELRKVLQQGGSDAAWKEYASLGKTECSWVLEDHPEKLTLVVPAALRHTPEKVVPMLLSRAVGDKRELHAHPEHPLRQIEDWVRAAWPNRGEAVARREAVLGATLTWHGNGGDLQTALQAIGISFSPDFRVVETTPGSGHACTYVWGCISLEELGEIQRLWPRVVAFLRRNCDKINDWTPIHRTVEAWAYPGRSGPGITEEVARDMRQYARKMLGDVAALAEKRPGVLQWCRHLADHLKADLRITVARVFEALFPVLGDDDWREAAEKHTDAARAVVREWQKQSAGQVAEQLLQCEQEAIAAGLVYPRYSPFVCAEIARTIPAPSQWAMAFIEVGLPADVVMPFVARATALRDIGWSELLETCFGRDDLRGVGVSVVLTMHEAPDALVGHALENLDGLEQLVESHCLRNEVAEDRIMKLLQHAKGDVAAAAVSGEWHADPKGSVRGSLREAWRTAVVTRVRDKYSLNDIFQVDPTLAYEWLAARIDENSQVFWREENIVNTAVAQLSRSQRKELLQRMKPDFWPHGFVQTLVGNDLELYEQLLATPRLERLHLAPLQGHPTGDLWVEKALLALGAGRSPEEIVDGAYGQWWSWTGNVSDMWAEWAQCFGALVGHDDPRIREIGQIGRTRGRLQEERALVQEQEEAIHGE